MPGGIAPQERHQGLAALLGGFTPILRLQGVHVPDKPGIVDERLVGPAVKFLPAQAVEGDDDKAGVIAPFVAGNQRRKRQHSQ